MYQCEHCVDAIDPDHKCPGPDVKNETQPVGDRRAEHLRRHDETERVFRLRRIQELQEEGLALIDIAEELNLHESSVRSIMRKDRLRKLDEPLHSSLAMSLTNHAPDDVTLERIKEIRHAADELCGIIDRNCREGRETDLAKEHLEETAMWAVKSLVLPRQGGAVMTTEQFRDSELKKALDE